ncbi:MAG: aldo/keto reductase [Bacteroidota bacterium]
MRINIGLGTAAIGRPQYINIRQEKGAPFSLESFRAQGKTVLDEAYHRGIRYFDTAPGYGLAEDLLIEWVAEKNDPHIEVATKWGYTYTANFDPNAKLHEVKEHSLSKLNEQWATSKSLLPWLTTYQVHSATFETGVLENEAVLHRLAELKSLHHLHIGITTSGANQTDVLQRALAVEINGVVLFDVFQVTYNMLDQSLAAIAPQMTGQNKRLIIKEALANGRVFPNRNYPHYGDLYQTLKQLAEKYGVGMDAIALRFCLDTIGPYQVLSGAANPQHILENSKVNQFVLEKVDLEKLKSFGTPAENYWAERKKLGWN